MEFREELLRIIEKNSRMNTKELAVILGVAEDVVAEELKTLEDEGTICGYHTMVNWENVSTETVTAILSNPCPLWGVTLTSIRAVTVSVDTFSQLTIVW